MIYLLRAVDGEIEACEKIDRVAALVSQGYRMVTRAEYMDAWRAKDMARLERRKPKERAVGSRWGVGDYWKH